jgi:hypothetical protein
MPHHIETYNSLPVCVLGAQVSLTIRVYVYSWRQNAAMQLNSLNSTEAYPWTA